MSETPTPVFVVTSAPVPWPVDVRVPAAGGEFVTQRFTALIKVLSEAEYQTLLAVPEPAPAKPAPDAPAAPAAPEKTEKEHLEDNAQLFPSFIAGWGTDVQTPDGKPVPFSVQALKDVVTGPHGKAVSAGLWHAVYEVRHGVRLGNFAAPPVTG
jgi:hypothetical protein